MALVAGYPALRYARDAGSLGDGYEQRYERAYDILFTTLENESTVLWIPGLPRRGDWHPSWSGARCINTRVRQDTDNECLWRATCEYSTKYPPPGDDDPEPLNRPAKWSCEGVDVRWVEDQDQQQNQYADPVTLEPFRNPPENEHSLVKFIAKRNEASADWPRVATFNNTLNQSDYKGIPPRHLKLTVSFGEEQFENGSSYWPWTYVFLLNPLRPWQPVKILRKGTKYLDPATGKIRQVADDDGVYTGGETLLDAWGGKLPQGANPTYHDRFPYKETEFADLGF